MRDRRGRGAPQRGGHRRDALGAARRGRGQATCLGKRDPPAAAGPPPAPPAAAAASCPPPCRRRPPRKRPRRGAAWRPYRAGSSPSTSRRGWRGAASVRRWRRGCCAVRAAGSPSPPRPVPLSRGAAGRHPDRPPPGPLLFCRAERGAGAPPEAARPIPARPGRGRWRGHRAGGRQGAGAGRPPPR